MRYFIGFLITVGLIILLVVLLLTGGGGKKSPETTGQKPKTVSELAAYANTDAVVRMVIDGEINANQNHTALRITVGQNEVTFEQIQGYEGTVVNQKNIQ